MLDFLEGRPYITTMTKTAHITDLSTMDATILSASEAIFTLRSKKTGAYFTYEMRLSDDGKVRFVGVLTIKGKFATLGTIFQKSGDFKHNTKKSPVKADDARTVAFAWAWKKLSVAETAPAAFVQMDVFEGAPGLYGDHADKARIFYTCKSCDHTYVVDAKNTKAAATGSCPSCSKKLKGKKLKASFSTKGHVCNAACMYAKGHICECSCGGLNHGKGHMSHDHSHVPAHILSSGQPDLIAEYAQQTGY